MVLCNADAALGGGVIDFDFTICGETQVASIDDGNASATARSALVSNLVLLGIVIVAALLLSAAWACITSKELRAAACDLCLPSSLLSVWIAVVPSCMSSAVYLFARASRSTCVGVDVVLGSLGLLIALVPSGAFVLLWGCRVCGNSATWVCALKSEQEHNYLKRTPRLLHCLLRRRYEWRSNVSHEGKASNDMKAAWVVLSEYRELRYGALDAGVLAVVSCVVVLSGLTGSAECYGWSLVAVLLMAMQLVVLCTSHPLTSLFSTILSFTTLLLTVLSSLSQLVFVWAFAANISGMWLVNASAVLSLVVVGVSSTKMAYDVFQLIAAIHRGSLRLHDQHLSTTSSSLVSLVKRLTTPSLKSLMT